MRFGAIAALEVPPHDPVVEHPAVGAGQQQVGSFGAGQPADVLACPDKKKKKKKKKKNQIPPGPGGSSRRG